MIIIEAPHLYDGRKRSLFLAGGITDCPDWQAEIADLLNDLDLVLLNPRRQSFDIHDPKAAKEQIPWEFKHLRKADAISFWFPCEALCPIALYELGAWSMTRKPLMIGTHPKYSRRLDVEDQTALSRPEIKMVYDLPALSAQIRTWYNTSLPILAHL